MSTNKNQLQRREFIKRTSRAAAAAAVFGAGIARGAAGDKEPAALRTCVLGKTKVKVPILAYGGASLPKKWGNPYSIEERIKVVRYAYDQGVRYFDTAGSYMESESIIGKALMPVRKNIFLVSKVETTDPAEVRKAVENSLKKLQTDRLDAILIHGTPGIEHMTVKQAMKIQAELVKLQKEKIVGPIGMSAHSYYDKALGLISTGQFDLAMLSWGYLPRGDRQTYSPKNIKLREQCMEKAHKLGMGILGMKIVGAGMLGRWAGNVVPEFDKDRLKDLPGAAIRYALSDGRVDLAVIGMRRREDIDANIKTLSGDITYTKDDKALLEDFGTKALASRRMKRMKVE